MLEILGNIYIYVYIKDSDTDLVNVVDATKRVYCETKPPQLLGPPPYFLIGRLPHNTVMWLRFQLTETGRDTKRWVIILSQNLRRFRLF